MLNISYLLDSTLKAVQTHITSSFPELEGLNSEKYYNSDGRHSCGPYWRRVLSTFFLNHIHFIDCGRIRREGFRES
jgi:hypothetical protein